MSNQNIADSRVLRNSLTSLSPFPFKACSERIIDVHFLSAHRAKFSCKKFWPPFYFAGFDASRWGLGTGKTANSQRARSIQPKFQPVRAGKLVHLKRWTRFFETFPVGPNRSIELWTEISGNFGWMDRAHVRAATDQGHTSLVKYAKRRRLSQGYWGERSTLLQEVH